MSIEMLEGRIRTMAATIKGLTERARELQDRLTDAYETVAAVDTHLRAELRAGSLDAKEAKLRAARQAIADLKRRVQ